MITETEVREYVNALDSGELQRIYLILKTYYVDDTLSDEFQIWADLLSVFEKYAGPVENRLRDG